MLHKGEIMLDIGDPIQVSIGRSYGIEINDFAVTVAKTALWIAESQMMKETEDVVHMSLDFLPLKYCANITEGNALRLESIMSLTEDRIHAYVNTNGSGYGLKGFGRKVFQPELIRRGAFVLLCQMYTQRR